MTDPGDLTCQEFVELVTCYLDGAMLAEERARFVAHLDDCDGCTSYLAQFKLTIELVGQLREDDLRPEARNRLLAEFRDWKRAPGNLCSLPRAPE